MSELREELPEELEDSEIEKLEKEYEGFVVDDDKKANWCVDKIREALNDIDYWKKYYADQLSKIEDASNRTIDFMKMKLAEYFKTVPHKQTPTQETYPLPSGKLVMKKQKPEYDYDDEKLIPWLEANHPELVKVKKTADKTEVKKKFTYFDGQVVDSETAEVIPGVTATPRPDIFNVEGMKKWTKEA